MKRSDLTAEQLAFLDVAVSSELIGPHYVYDHLDRARTGRLGEIGMIEPIPGFCLIEDAEGDLKSMRPVYRLTDLGKKVLADQS